jgi:tetratricopeptide (TPR) repeat protein
MALVYILVIILLVLIVFSLLVRHRAVSRKRGLRESRRAMADFQRMFSAGRAGEQDRALDEFDQSTGELKDTAPTRTIRGMLLMAQGKYEKALDEFQHALAVEEDYTEALSGKGMALMHLGREAEAVDAFSQALAHEPDDADTLFNRARACAMKGDKEEALADLARAVEIDARFVTLAKSADEFSSLRDDEEFRRLLAQ